MLPRPAPRASGCPGARGSASPPGSGGSIPDTAAGTTPTTAEARLSRIAPGPAEQDLGRLASPIAGAVSELIDVLGVTDFTVAPAAHAQARSWDAAFGAGLVRVKGSGGLRYSVAATASGVMT